MKSFFNLDKLILSTLILWTYRILVVLVPLCLVIGTFSAPSFGEGLLILLLGIPLCILSVRIYCELFYLAVGIYNRLGEIRDLLSGTKDASDNK